MSDKISAEPKVDSQLAGWTSPSDIPQDVAKKILKARQALLESNIDEAYNALYSIADPEFSDPFPWRILEKKSNRELYGNVPPNTVTAN